MEIIFIRKNSSTINLLFSEQLIFSFFIYFWKNQIFILISIWIFEDPDERISNNWTFYVIKKTLLINTDVIRTALFTIKTRNRTYIVVNVLFINVKKVKNAF